jgi:polysaccharide chain length determinant protein (PEP-CTERM system associated)
MQEIIGQLLDYLRGVWRNRWYALMCAWVICLIGWAMVYRMPDQYRASARVFVDTQSILRPLMRGLAIDADPGAQIGLVTRTLLSRPNLEKIARLTDLDIQATDPEALNRLLANLANQIQLGPVSRQDQNLYNVSHTDRDPQHAKNVVQAVVTVFAENLLGDSRLDTDNAQRFLDKQINEYETRLIEGENQLREFKLKNMGLMPSEGSSYYNRMQQVTSDLEAIKLEMTQAENRRNALLQQIENEKPTVESTFADPWATQAGGAISLPVDARIQSLEQKLDELLIKYTEKHPDVIIIRGTLADLRQQREEDLARYKASLANANSSGSGYSSPQMQANPIYQQLKMALSLEEANLVSLQVKKDEYEKRRKELQDQVNAVLNVEAQLTALNRDYALNRKKYEEFLARRETARLSEQVEQTNQGVRFRIIEPPRAPSAPTGPNRPLLMSLVLGAGLAGGIGLSLLISLIWPTFDSRHSLMRITQVPVFGSVSAMLSPAVARRQRWWLLGYFALGSCLFMLYGGLVVVETMGYKFPL